MGVNQNVVGKEGTFIFGFDIMSLPVPSVLALIVSNFLDILAHEILYNLTKVAFEVR